MHPPLRTFFVFCVPLLVLDIATKEWVRSTLEVGGSMPIIDGFRFWHRVNTGAAWSFLGDKSWGIWVLSAAGVVATGVMVQMVRKLPSHDRVTAGALGAVASGAVGNLIDRVRFQRVTDFFDVYAEEGPLNTLFRTIAGGSHYPTFNVADIGIVCGAVLLFILGFRKEPAVAPAAVDETRAQ